MTIATVTSSYIGRIVFGSNPSFVIPAFETPVFHYSDPVVLIFYVVLGLIIGVVSLIYIRSIYIFEDFFDKRVPGNYLTRHTLGMFAVGVIMYVLMLSTGHYHVEGVGYATVQDILSGDITWVLLILCVLKLLVTSLTLGSGASGGIFSPALFFGATLGGFYGLVLHQLFPGLPIRPTAFAVAGMAAVVGASTGAALAAIVMIFEMTLDYTIIIPMTITVALSYGVRSLLHRQSIYTEKLARRGHEIPAALQANFYYLRKTRDIMDQRFVAVPADGSIDEFMRIASAHPDISCFLVEGTAGLVGFLTRDTALRPTDHQGQSVTLAEMADRKYISVDENTPLLEVITRMRSANAAVALVFAAADQKSSDGIRGLVTKQQIANEVIDGIDLFAT